MDTIHKAHAFEGGEGSAEPSPPYGRGPTPIGHAPHLDQLVGASDEILEFDGPSALDHLVPRIPGRAVTPREEIPHEHQ